MADNDKNLPLKYYVKETLKQYFETIDGEKIKNLYQMLIDEVEAPLLRSVMEYAGYNQSKAASILGLNRGTLRKKLSNHNLLKD